MNTSSTQSQHFKPKLGNIAIVIAVATAMAALGIAPAFGDEHGNRGHERHRDHHYAQPFYASAPVYYTPQPSPGISLFIPIVIR